MKIFPYRFIALIALAVLVFASTYTRAAITIYVSPQGSDQATGETLEIGDKGPVASLSEALAKTRQLRIQNSGAEQSLIIKLLPGTYRLSAPILIGANDSGSALAPLIIEGESSATVRLTGGFPIRPSLISGDDAIMKRIPVAKRDTVRIYEVRSNGISEWRSPVARGFGISPNDYPSELFADGDAAVPARWPNQGFVKISAIPDQENGKRFVLGDALPGLNSGVKLMAFGYWFHDWADALLPVEHLGSDNAFRFVEKLPHYGIKLEQRVYLAGLPEFLDSPGEWYLDETSGTVYVIPKQSNLAEKMELSVALRLLQLDHVRHVIIRHLTFDQSRADLVVAQDVNHLKIEHCVFKNSGYGGVRISGTDSGIRQSLIEFSGGVGIALSGGNRKSLQASDLYALDNTIRSFGRTYRTYQSALSLQGVGISAAYNKIDHGPHAGILFDGNDHYIGYNEISHVALETGDVGAIYTGRDWTARGTLIEKNYLHDIQGVGKLGAMGIYLDDQASGITIRKNLFARVSRAVFIGGGLDNVVENNLFIRSSPSVHLDHRGMNWQKEMAQNPTSTLHTRLKAVPYDRPPYLERYPTLAKIEQDGFGIPMRNRIQFNLAIDSIWSDINLPQDVLQHQTIEHNWIDVRQEEVWQNVPSLDLEQSPAAFAIPATAKSYREWQNAGLTSIPLETFGPRR